jgi:hypothetical protein
MEKSVLYEGKRPRNSVNCIIPLVALSTTPMNFFDLIDPVPTPSSWDLADEEPAESTPLEPSPFPQNLISATVVVTDDPALFKLACTLLHVGEKQDCSHVAYVEAVRRASLPATEAAATPADVTVLLCIQRPACDAQKYWHVFARSLAATDGISSCIALSAEVDTVSPPSLLSTARKNGAFGGFAAEVATCARKAGVRCTAMHLKTPMYEAAPSTFLAPLHLLTELLGVDKTASQDLEAKATRAAARTREKLAAAAYGSLFV